MRSSVVEPLPASQPGDTQGQRHQYQPLYSPRKPYSPRPTSKHLKGTSERSLVLAPAEGWLVLVLLAVAVYCVVFSISQLGWVGNTFILNWSATVGLVVGLMVAKIEKFPQVILHMAACLVGHWLSIWLVSSFAWHVPWTLLIAKIGAIITDPTNSGRSDMVFLFYLSFLSFFLGHFGAWLIYRAHLPWLVAIVYASILLINLSYVPHDLSSVIAIQVTALILLIARAQLAAKLLQWKSEGLYTDRTWLRGITLRFTQFASVMVLLTLVISWLLPVLGQPSAGETFWNELNNVWNNALQGNIQWQDPAAALQPYQPSTNFFSDHLTISGSVHLPTGEVLSYTSTATTPQYLAGFSFDHFDGHTWTSLANVNSSEYTANHLLPTDETTASKEVKTSVTIVQPPDETKHFVFGPPQPSAFSMSTVIYGTPLVSAWAQEDALRKGEEYVVTSSILTASSSKLAAIPLPQNDPNHIWKQDTNYTPLQLYYTQVPTNLSPQVSQTAQQWTRGATSAYHALQMLVTHLSDATQFTYSQDNSMIPSNVDAISWLLQTHRGYCTYYATAMTIMARQLGIPARMMNGFSQGHFDTLSKVWVVDGNDAHSWVQAFFPGLGWLNFDPTPGYNLSGNGTTSLRPTTTPVPTATAHPTQPKSTPPAKNKTTSPSPLSVSGNGSTANTNGAENMLFDLSMVALLCSVVIFLLAMARYWWRSLYAESTFIAATFWRLCRIASWVGLSPRRWQTPYEYSRILCQRMPQEAPSLWRLTELFVRERWAPVSQTPSAMTDTELRHIWPGLRRIFVHLLWMKAQKR